MNTEKNSIDILLESLSDEQWSKIKLRADANRAHRAAERYNTKRDSAIKFSEWILKQNISKGYDNEGSTCWLNLNDQMEDEKTYTSQELYSIYINGVWDEDEEDIYINGVWDEDEEDEVDEEELLPTTDRGCCPECGEGYDNEEEWLYNTECEVCGHPIPDHLIIKKS